ncbi:glycosyltransferase [Draconibacterium halophilum]|uniref:Glycosyltransferase n=1 Tax=Draconibacterium halophilum TaxID=2706887 RepID=A0A6C0REM7_9BACT|nr:glycosyltransferase [Draconibacterium halophilum]QIA08527.1 glycosyltransferase [Draconibacterium halophilum]
MKILQINKFYFPDLGGIETIVQQYAEYLNKWDNVTVLCINKNFTFKTKIEIINDVNIIRCSSFGTFLSMPISISFFIYFIKEYLKADITHFHEPFPIASLLSPFLSKNKKHIITWHSDIIKQKSLKKIIEFFQSKLCEKSSIILTTSPQLLEFSSVISKFKEKVKILPLSIDEQKYIPQNLSINQEEYILYLGRLSYYKGIHILLEAYAKCQSSIKLKIIGDGDSEIIKLINNYKLKENKKIEFINDFVSEENKKYILQHCLFFVFPSNAPSEAFGIIQLEAMIFNKPVINTNLDTGVPFVSVHDKTGITVEQNNSESLANAIDKLSFDANYRQLLGNNAKKRVLKYFSNSLVLPKLHKIYEKL